MNDLALLFTVGLAAWRLAYFLVEDSGPFGFMDWIRDRMCYYEGKHWDGLREVETIEIHNAVPFVGGVLSCVLCASFWTALLAWGVSEWEPNLLLPPAAWGIATLFAVHSPED